ncbi:gamma-glutamyl-gamma-aminobutyrate hydrolase family protein [Kitasatospora sp. NPDC052896]|uniref:gamma-glutamyl-gamma-aminobutyrate hydrolase family protein n=1 Tax=Kitasatospora sp. NPDC052896 TaxID=3364061 RepID=UPI0037C79C14
MSQKPLIGISAYRVAVNWGSWRARPVVLVPEHYADQVRACGGLPVLLPPNAPEHAPELLAPLDGLVVSGGGDVNPALYGQPADPHTDPPEPERDAFEGALLRAALAAGLPLLAICRGMQLLNVVCGGSLVQHLPDLVGHHGHGAVEGGRYDHHPVRPLPGTLLAELLPEPVLSVPTLHHQAADRIGEGLRVSALAEDGTVEAVEGPGFVLGVQWHPEQGDDQRLTEALVRAAGVAAAERAVSAEVVV